VRATLRRLAGGGRSAVGILNVIYGIAAIGDSKFFVADQKYMSIPAYPFWLLTVSPSTC